MKKENKKPANTVPKSTDTVPKPETAVPPNNKIPNAGLNRERAELFKKININAFEELAKKKGVTLEQLISAGIKAYLEKEEKN
jgi:hypothetical protein